MQFNILILRKLNRMPICRNRKTFCFQLELTKYMYFVPNLMFYFTTFIEICSYFLSVLRNRSRNQNWNRRNRIILTQEEPEPETVSLL